MVLVSKGTTYQQAGTPCTEECCPNFHKKQTFGLHVHANGQQSSFVISTEIGGTKNNSLIKMIKEIWTYLITNQITNTAEYHSDSLVIARIFQYECYKGLSLNL